MAVDQDVFIDCMMSVCASREQNVKLLDTAIEDLSFDSLDLEILRATLEKARGCAIDENLWQTARTLRNLMEGL